MLMSLSYTSEHTLWPTNAFSPSARNGMTAGILSNLLWSGTGPDQKFVIAVLRSVPAGRQVLLPPASHFCGMQVGANHPSSPVWPVLTVITRPGFAAK